MSCQSKCRKRGCCAEDCPEGQDKPCRKDCEVV
jgi:hypothetical protein